MKIILGSKSPRRKEILSLMGYDFEVRISEAEEEIKSTNPKEVVQSIARQKANNISINDDELLICADTIVVLDNKILGKPADLPDARRMISSLQGRYHFVYTAVCLKYQGKQTEFVDEAEVAIYPMSDKEIEEYINTTEPYDKAGGYAIQGIFSKYIKAYAGDYYTIMGLPKERLEEVLLDMKI